MISTKQRSASLATGRWDWVNTKLPDDYPMDYLAGRLELFTVSLPGFSWFGDWFVQRVSISNLFCTKTRFIKSLNNQDYGMLFLSQIQVPRCSLAHEM